MRAGFIGAGRVGFSLGKYLANHGIPVSGYYDHTPEHAAEAAEFTGTETFEEVCELVRASDLVFVTTPDGRIREVWDTILADSARPGTEIYGDNFRNETMKKEDAVPDEGSIQRTVDRNRNAEHEMLLPGKIICHCSGSLTSEVFAGIRNTGASGCSLHPMLAFSDRHSSFRQLEQAFFTVEGDAAAVEQLTKLFESLGNRVCPIRAEQKALYHTAASVLSNQVVAVLDTGYRLLMECGFSEEDARDASEQLVRGNVEHVIRDGSVKALTGPIERGDAETVAKHLACLEGEDREMYRILARKLVRIARVKNPDRDYLKIEEIL